MPEWRAGVGVGKDGLTWEAGLCLPANLLSVLADGAYAGSATQGPSLPLPTTLPKSVRLAALSVLTLSAEGLGGGICCTSFRVTLQQRRTGTQCPAL